MSKKLAPSEINFVKMANIIEDSVLIDDLWASKLEPTCIKIPPMQVAKKEGAWFALNNLSLHLARQLERRGMCTKVDVNIVPLTKIPQSVQSGMIAERKCRNCGRVIEDDTPLSAGKGIKFLTIISTCRQFKILDIDN